MLRSVRLPAAPSVPLAPAILQAPGGVLRFDPGYGFVGDQDFAGVDVARRLLARIGEVDDRLHAELDHLLGELHGRRADLAVLDVLDTGAAAVDRRHQDVLLLAPRLDGSVGALSGRLVDGGD